MKDFYREVTARIAAEIASGTPPWAKPWRDSRVRGIGMLPSNLTTGRLYSGMNTLLLWMVAHERGYSSLQYCTFDQARKAGAKVRSGEKACKVIYVDRAVREDKETGESKVSTFAKVYSVFNVNQLENVPDRFLVEQQPLDLTPPSQQMQEFVNGTGADVRFGFNQACYVPSQDCIKMPAFGVFEDEASFAGTLFHELTHWTGADHRLKRTFGKRFGDENYAAEELVAELGSAFLCGRIGYQPTFRSASYINTWLKVLNTDSRAIFSAASFAGQASDYLWNLAYGEHETKQAAE
jgi:antirestriction protein ArdC